MVLVTAKMIKVSRSSSSGILRSAWTLSSVSEGMDLPVANGFIDMLRITNLIQGK